MNDILITASSPTPTPSDSGPNMRAILLETARREPGLTAEFATTMEILTELSNSSLPILAHAKQSCLCGSLKILARLTDVSHVPSIITSWQTQITHSMCGILSGHATLSDISTMMSTLPPVSSNGSHPKFSAEGAKGLGLGN